MIWIKRVLPFVLAGVIWAGYHLDTQEKVKESEKLFHKYTNIEARVWMASAKYRDDAEGFIVYRDSLLMANGVSISDMKAFLDSYKEEPENLEAYSLRLSFIIDSLILIEDSLRISEDTLITDSTNQ